MNMSVMGCILFVAIGEALVGDMISGILSPSLRIVLRLVVFQLSTDPVKARLNVKRSHINSRGYELFFQSVVRSWA
jgi:hypothetical protein